MSNEWQVPAFCYNWLKSHRPNAIMLIEGLLKRGKTPDDIQTFIAKHQDDFMAGVYSCAAQHIKEGKDE